MNFKEEIAKKLLEIDAISLTTPDQLFTWASGIKSPIYCDNRLVMSYPAIRDMVADALKDLVQMHYPDVNLLVGTATAGIPHAAWTAQKMNLPMAYVRSNPKEHGKGNKIEGRVQKGDRVVVIEDLLSTGGSSIKVVNVLKEVGADVLGIAAIFTYGFSEMDEKFKNEKIPCFTVTDYKTLIAVARKGGRISEEEEKILSIWSENPTMFTDI